MSFHFFLSATNSFHLITPSTWRSLSASSFYPFLGLPLLLVPSSSWVKIFLGILSSSILSRWPNQPILCPFIHFTIFSSLLISSSSRGNFCYYSYIWAAQLIRGVFHFGISFSCWFSGLWITIRVFCSLFTLHQGFLRTRTLCVRSLCSRIWWSREKGVRRYQNNRCRDTLGGFSEQFLDLGQSFSIAEVSGFL